MIIDTHCHLIDEAFLADVDEVVNNSIQAGVGKIVLACCDEKEFTEILELSDRYPEVLYPTIGIHPENMAEDVKSQFSALFDRQDGLQNIVAVGEIGIDLHWDKSRLSDQLWLLEKEIFWALDHNLPVLLHIRDAMPEFLEFCRNSLYINARAKEKRLRGILHCYSGNEQQADEVQKYGDFLFGIGGTLTYKKSQVPEVAKHIGLSKIVLETDAPYLAPVPHRGQRNEPAYTADTCRALAEILETTAEEVAHQTTSNARELFGF